MRHFCVDYSPTVGEWTNEDAEILFVRGQRLNPMLQQERKSSSDLTQYREWFAVQTPAQIRMYGG